MNKSGSAIAGATTPSNSMVSANVGKFASGVTKVIGVPSETLGYRIKLN